MPTLRYKKEKVVIYITPEQKEIIEYAVKKYPAFSNLTQYIENLVFWDSLNYLWALKIKAEKERA